MQMPAPPAPRPAPAHGARRARTLATMLAATVILLSGASILLYQQAVRHSRLADYQRTVERLFEASLSLTNVETVGWQDSDDDAPWAQAQRALDAAGAAMVHGPARWAPELAATAEDLRRAALASGPLPSRRGLEALERAASALRAVAPARDGVAGDLGRAALLLGVLWTFAGVAVMVLGGRGHGEIATHDTVPYADELDVRLTQRLLLELPWGGGACGAIVMRLDNLQAISDVHGHAAACAVVEAIGAALQRSVRHGDVLARASADAFLIVLPDAAPQVLDGAAARLRSVAQSAAQALETVRAQPVQISTASASGLADEPLESLIARTRAQLHAAAGESLPAAETPEQGEQSAHSHQQAEQGKDRHAQPARPQIQEQRA
ncbi:diguanylate cyclase [Verticiella sediminum]|uniref:Diguanylate cyclase n=1 Tax=Verticiella sediminum TaxID=1247510 RepID=A0A556ATK4_9BURK|nr:diguanylate cyclase [Verticiella sediminum]